MLPVTVAAAILLVAYVGAKATHRNVRTTRAIPWGMVIVFLIGLMSASASTSQSAIVPLQVIALVVALIAVGFAVFSDLRR